MAALADAGERLEGSWPGDDLPRWAQSQSMPQDVVAAEIRWQARGDRRAAAGREPEIWLHLNARTSMWLTCQRCLQPFESPCEVDRRIRFVRTEAEAEALDAESEDDVLALVSRLDLQSLLEDELLLALPLVPRHERCPQPLPIATGDSPPDETDPGRPNPFEVLRSIGKRGSSAD